VTKKQLSDKRRAARDPDAYLRHTSEEFNRAPDRLRRFFLGWLKAPCRPEDCSKHLRYRHFTCLSCWERRARTPKQSSGFRYVKRIVMVSESVSGRTFVMPKHYSSYALICKTRVDGKLAPWKWVPLKILMSIAERIAEW